MEIVKFTVLENFKHDRDQYIATEIRHAEREAAEYFAAQGWVEIDDKPPAEMFRDAEHTLEVQNGEHAEHSQIEGQ